MQVTRVGDGLGVRLPDSLVADWKLREGDEVELNFTASRDYAADRKAEIHDALVRLRKYRGLLPADFRFDREEANARR